MPISFPTTPTTGLSFSSGGNSWIWNGTVWNSNNTTSFVSNAQTATTYTFVAADAFALVSSNNTGATTFTIPPHSSAAFPLPCMIYLQRLGTGSLTVAAGAGVTLTTSSSATLRAQYSAGTLVQTVQDTWVLVGDLT